jgi:transcriptional regulator with XRE-family HTH domain
MSRRADHIDQLVGRNIRVLRLKEGMSQTALANALGVTFQQVQKYENGTNRVGSGRLLKIADLFKVPVAVLFEGAEDWQADNAAKLPSALLAEPYALRIVQACCSITNEELRRRLAELIEAIARARPAR